MADNGGQIAAEPPPDTLTKSLESAGKICEIAHERSVILSFICARHDALIAG